MFPGKFFAYTLIVILAKIVTFFTIEARIFGASTGQYCGRQQCEKKYTFAQHSSLFSSVFFSLCVIEVESESTSGFGFDVSVSSWG